MRNVRARISYDGSRFYGWQRQEGFESVQQAIEEALEAVVGERVIVRGSGRTDTGAHALGQVASFHVGTRLDDERLLFAVNAHLPEGVALRELETCSDDFHAQRHARGKRYGYIIETSRIRSPFPQRYAHWVSFPLDVGAMRAAAGHLVGRHDFTSLANAGSPRKSNVREIHAIHIFRRRGRLLTVVQGSGFLYMMVRTLMGTLVEVGRGKLDPGAIPELLDARDRRLAGATLPASGLYLLSVLYPEPAFIGCRR